MTRTATIQHKQEDFSYEVLLYDGNQVVHRTIHEDYTKAQQAKNEWVSGGGPELIVE